MTPKTIQVYFEAERIRQQKQDEFAWLIGAYVRQALSSTPITAIASLAEKLNINKLPKYPDKPFLSDNKKVENEKPLTEEQKRAESIRLFEYLKKFGGDTNGVRFNN